MDIEGLNNIYNIPPVKKERETGLNRRKKQKRRDEERHRKENREQDSSKHDSGKIDIKI